MLNTHPQKRQLNVVFLPLAKEALNSFANIPLPIRVLKEECHAFLIKKLGFKSVDFALLNDDSLWYLRQLEITQTKKNKIIQFV